MSTVLEHRTEVQYWGGPWKPLAAEDFDIPIRLARGETLEGIHIRTVVRTVTRSDWKPLESLADLAVKP